MKKLLQVLGIATVAFGAFDASADSKTITVVVDNPDHVVVRNPADSYNPVTFDNDNSAEITLDYSAPVQANDGWTLSSIADAEGLSATHSSLPATSASIDADLVEDGEVVYITTAEKEIVTFTIIPDNPEAIMSVVYEYQNQILTDGMWTFPITNPWGNVNINVNPDYVVDSLKDDKGNDITYYGSNPSIYCGSYSESTTFYITTSSKAESRTAAMTVILDGNPDDVVMRRSDGSVVALSTGEQSVAYDPNTENPFSLSHSTYGKNIFKVELDGTVLTPSYGYYSFYAVNGGTLVITVDYPDVDVPVSISYSADNLEGIIKNLTIDGQIVDPAVWSSSDFTVKAGSSLSMEMNYDRFQNIFVTVNGANAPMPFVIGDADRYDFEINGERIEDKTITIYCVEWQNLEVSYNNQVLSLTGEETVINVPGNAYSIQFKGLNNYIIEGLYDYDTNEPIQNYNGQIYNITDGMKIVVELEYFQRNELAVIYLQDTTWNYIAFRMGRDATYTEVNLQPGYNEVYFNPADLPFQLYGTTSTYGNPVVYLNGELCEYMYGAYAGFDAVKNGDVIMVYDQEMEPFAVNLEIADDVNVDVTKNLVENVAAGVFNALPGTLIEIEGEGVLVSVNGEAVEAAEANKYDVTVNAEMTISVTKDPNTGVNEVSADTDANVYSVDGKLILKDATQAQIMNLPAGLYIVGGKKVMVK